MTTSPLSINSNVPLRIVVWLGVALSVPAAHGQVSFKSLPAVPLCGGEVYATAVGDFDGNGVPDVAAVDIGGNTNSLCVLVNDGTGALRLAYSYVVDAIPEAIATADLNGDGSLDLVVPSVDPISGDWGYSVLLGNGDGSFQSPAFYAQSVFGLELSGIVIADFNGDGKPDLAVATGSGVAVLFGKGDGTFGSAAYFSPGVGNSIVSADFNGDGKLDIAVGGLYGNNDAAILLGNGDGTFQPAVPLVNSSLQNVLTADLNGDGKADVVNGSQAFLGNGDDTFNAPVQIGQLIEGPYVQVLSDINGDGKPDAIGGRQQSSQYCDMGLFLGNGDGTFGSYVFVLQALSSVGTPICPPYASIEQGVDLNGDGKPDLLVMDAGSLLVLINTTVSVPLATLSPSSLTFASQTVETTSNPTPVMLTNPGAANLMVSSVTFSGVNAGEFQQTNNCNTVQPLASCTINVTFIPSTIGNASASLMVTDNASGSPQAVALSGTAVSSTTPQFTFYYNGSGLQIIAPGGTASYGLFVLSSVWTGSVSLTCSGAPKGAVCTVPSSVTVGTGSATLVNMSVTTTAAGAAVVHSKRGVWMLTLGVLGFVLLPVSKKRSPFVKYLNVLPLALVMMLGGCGGGGSGSEAGGGGSGTPAGTYSLTVTATATGASPQSITLELVVQ
ncbi:MAG: FG-GAP-like repeat-containing protein [Terriglobales bacterium]|jgi:hypothetical protein